MHYGFVAELDSTVAVVFKEDLITECTNTMLENIG